jgi:hypothetical protein
MKPSKLRLKVADATATVFSGKKRVSTRKTKTKPSTARYFEAVVRVPKAVYLRAEPYFKPREGLSKFVLDALLERINRAEANDKNARLRKLLSDEGLLEPVLKHMHETGKLAFLIEK